MMIETIDNLTMIEESAKTFAQQRILPHVMEWDESQTFPRELFKGALIISGDRHISEFSQKNIGGLPYPLIDFTSSGLTHSYRNFTGEPNQYRIGYATNTLSFGLIKWNFKSGIVQLEMRGLENKLISQIEVNMNVK